MFPRDYYDAFIFVDKGLDKKGQRIYNLEAKDVAMCPCCKGTNIVRNGYHSKSGFRDITAEDKTVVLSLKRWRYICKDCSAEKVSDSGEPSVFTFSSPLPTCVPEGGKVSTHLVDRIIEKIVAEHKSITAAAKDFGVSQGAVSAQIKVRREQVEACFQSWQPADYVLIYPFYYSSKNEVGQKKSKKSEEYERKYPTKPNCCGIFGVVGSSVLLYTILTSCRESTIIEQLRKIPFDNNELPAAVITDYPRKRLFKALPDLYGDIDVAIERTYSFALMEPLLSEYNDDVTYDLLALKRLFEAHCEDPISGEFLPIDIDNSNLPSSLDIEDVDDSIERYSNHSKSELVCNTFKKMFVVWKSNCSESSSLADLCRKIESNIEEVALGLEYTRDEYDPARLLQFLKHCRQNKIPRDHLWSWLALVADIHNKENITAQQLLTSTFLPKPVHRFCIDLVKLNRILNEEAST